MSSNLPPGVTESMIPGNRPEDAEDEQFWETLLSGASEEVLAAFESEQFADIVYNARDLGYAAGWNDALEARDVEDGEYEQFR